MSGNIFQGEILKESFKNKQGKIEKVYPGDG
jgi:hypothetical protein